MRLILKALLLAALPVLAGCHQFNSFMPTRNKKPIASFDVERLRTDDIPGTFFVKLDASRSSDDSLPLVLYKWTLGDGSPTFSIKEAVIPKQPFRVQSGTLVTITLQVTDDDGELSDPVSQPLSLTANRVPIARFSATADANDPRSVTFDASASTDADTDDLDFLKYDWNFGDSTTAPLHSRNRVIQHVYSAAGSYRVVLTVDDRKESSTPVSLLITVR